MTKETITDRIIKEDAVKYLKKMVNMKKETASITSWYFCIPLIFAPVAWFFGWVIFSLCIISAIVLFLPYYKKMRALKAELVWVDGLEFEVVKEKLISRYTEELHEPHYVPDAFRPWKNHIKSIRQVYVLSFNSGKWRVLDENYTWSNDLQMTAMGVEASSLPGEEFFVVRVKGGGDVCAAYNTKFFKYATE